MGGDIGPLDRRMTVRSRLRTEAGFLVVVALVIFGLFAALTYGGVSLGTDTVSDQVRSRVQGNAALAVTFVEDTLGSIETLAQDLASAPELVAAVGRGEPEDVDTSQISSIVGPPNRWSRGISAIGVVSLDGRLVTVSPAAPELEGTDFSYRDWYQGVVAADDLYVSEVYVSSIAGNPRVIAVATPIRRPTGESVGYLLITYEVDAIETFVDQFADRGILFTITDQRGVVVAAPGATSDQLVSELDDPFVTAALAGASGHRDRTADGEEWVSAYAPVTGPGWTVRADVPAAAAYASVNTLRRTMLGLAAVLAFVLCGAMCIVARSVVRRRQAERRLVEAASSLAADRERLAAIVAAQHDVAAAGIDTAQILCAVTTWAAQLTRADGVAVLLPDRGELVVRCAAGDASPADGLRLPAEFFSGLSEDEATIRGQTPAERRSGAAADLIDRLQMRSFVMISLPLAHGASIAGLMMVSSRVPDAFGESDASALKLITGMAGMALAEAASFATIEEGERRHRAVTDHLPDTAVMVWDSDLRLQTVGGPGVDAWRYPERGVVPGRLLEEIVSPAELAILGPLYRSGLTAPGGLDYHSIPTGLDFRFEVAPMFAGDGSPAQVLVMVRDVTQQKRDTEALRVAEKRFRTAFEAAPVGIAEIDLDGNFRSVNVALCDLTGRRVDELTATNWMAITHPDDVADCLPSQTMMAAGERDEFAAEMRLFHADGSTVWVSVSTAVVVDGAGRPEHLLSHYLDVTERKRLDVELQHLADHDPLTGLLNRRSFEAELDRHVASVGRYGPAGALFVLDLDRFKRVNDTLGHSVGDEMIVALADVLARRLRTTDVVARLGGDEFAVILPRATAREAEQVARSILDAVREEIRNPFDDDDHRMTTSIGIALFDDPRLTGKEVLIKADLSMYQAKSAGRDRYALHRSAMGTDSSDDARCPG